MNTSLANVNLIVADAERSARLWNGEAHWRRKTLIETG